MPDRPRTQRCPAAQPIRADQCNDIEVNLAGPGAMQQMGAIMQICDRAVSGNSQAYYELAMILLNGDRGARPNPQLAQRLLAHAAELGLRPAYVALERLGCVPGAPARGGGPADTRPK